MRDAEPLIVGTRDTTVFDSYAAAMTDPLTPPEREYLKSQPLARLATVDAAGAPQNSPVGAFYDEESGDILIGGGRHGRQPEIPQRPGQRPGGAGGRRPRVASDPWTVRDSEIRGTAVRRWRMSTRRCRS